MAQWVTPQKQSASTKPRYSCLNCDFRYHELVQCPKCRKNSLRTEEQIRMNGIALIIASLVLTAMMAAILAFIGFVLAALRTKPITDRDLFQLALFAPILIGISVFGLSGILEGLWRAFSGAPSRWIFRVFGVIALLLSISGVLIKIAAFVYFN